MKCWIMFPQIKNFWKFWKKSDENSIRISEILCDFENILSIFQRISEKLFEKLSANFGEIPKHFKKLIKLEWNFTKN